MMEQRLRKPAHTVALIAANPALTSLLQMVLGADPDLRVRAFADPQDLRTYMRVVPVDLVVVDFDCESAPAEALALILRADQTLASQGFRLIALARTADEGTRLAALRTGMDEVIIKPMSPRHLLERVRARLKTSPEALSRPVAPMVGERRRRTDKLPPFFRQRPVYKDNVVPLFPHGMGGHPFSETSAP